MPKLNVEFTPNPELLRTHTTGIPYLKNRQDNYIIIDLWIDFVIEDMKNEQPISKQSYVHLFEQNVVNKNVIKSTTYIMQSRLRLRNIFYNNFPNLK